MKKKSNWYWEKSGWRFNAFEKNGQEREKERKEMGCGASTPMQCDDFDMDISKHGGDGPDDIAFARAVALAPAPEKVQ